MKNKQTIILIGISIIITFGLTKAWDFYKNTAEEEVSQNLKSEEHSDDGDHDKGLSVVSISPEELKEFNIKIDKAGPEIGRASCRERV